jgi:prevent-host-death family protein
MHYQEVSAFDAKTHFSQLLAEVRQGEQFIITWHNQPVATLTPIANARSNKSQIEAIRKLKELSKGQSLGGITIKELIESGRKW